MSANLIRPVGNWVLDALPSEDYERLLPNLERVSFSLGEVVYESGIQMGHAYFPTTCHVSLLYTMIESARFPSASHTDVFKMVTLGIVIAINVHGVDLSQHRRDVDKR